MAAGESSWLKQLETWSAVVGALGSVAVPILLYIVAERIDARQHALDEETNQRALIISATGYLLDDNPTKREAGFILVGWIGNGAVKPPPELLDLASKIAQEQPATATTALSPQPSTQATTPSQTVLPPLASSPLPPPVEPSARPVLTPAPRSISQTASDALGGLVPRVFIQIADDSQRPAAEAVRNALQRMTATDGRLVVAPGVERVARQAPLKQVQLRFLKRADQVEAADLKQKLDALLGTDVSLVDASDKYNDKPAVKQRTYELWFPPGPISVNTAAAG
jgi:hypothetical protein